MDSLFTLQRNYVLLAITSIRSSNGYKCYLIVDAHTEALLAPLLTANELREHVFAVERVDGRRLLNPMYEAIYLLSPCDLSVECLVTDYKYLPTRYKRGHVFLLPGVSDRQQATIHNQERSQGYLKSVGTLYWALAPYESQVFTVPHTPKALQVFHNEACADAVTLYVSKSVEALVNLCVVTGEYPIVRHYAPEDDSYRSAGLCHLLASAFQTAIDEYARANPDFPPQTARPRAQLIFSDRTVDHFAPLLHEFTYQAMVHDVIPLEGETYAYTDTLGAAKRYTLSDTDSQWRQLRHLHVLDAGEKIRENQARFLRENPTFYQSRDEPAKVRVSEVAQQLLHKDRVFAEEREIYLHSQLTQHCGAINTERRLAELSIIEQDCAAFGAARDGSRLVRIIEDALSLLADARVAHTDKFRFIAVYALYRGGLVRSDFTKLFTFAQCWTTEQMEGLFRLLSNLALLGFPVIKPDLKSKGFRKQMFHHTENSDPYDSSRFRPAVETIVEQATASQLDEEAFPFFRDRPVDAAAAAAPTLRLHKAVWAKGTQYQPPKQRIFYFVAGGMAFSEMRSCYTLSAKLEKEVYIGSNEVLAPSAYLEALRELSLSRERLRLPVDEPSKKQLAPDYLVTRGVEGKTTGPRPSCQNPLLVTPLPPVSLLPIPSLPTPVWSAEATPTVEEKKRSRFKKLFK